MRAPIGSLNEGSSTSSSRSGVVENLIAHGCRFLKGDLCAFRPVGIGGVMMGFKSRVSGLGKADSERALWELGSWDEVWEEV